MAVRVFLVEDLQSLRGLLDAFTRIAGLSLAGVASGEAEARDWLDENPGGWDLLIVNPVLDQGSGLAVVKHAAHLGQPGQIAVFSAYATPLVAAHCLRLGADAVFDKISTNSFIQWLREQVEEARQVEVQQAAS